ncbi:autoimmune regulator [Harpia harpyja]|uniref:autoimmune regulator n=1 Tax=Harpia harpyja TaxID=202280 RepID=UPI0022B1D2CF|nr:autoimmune regulator [Harpia harpyja]
MAGPGGEGDLRHLLKLHRTEIAMAVDDVFPLLHGLADHDIVPEHIFKETLSRTEQEGSHRAFHALLTWLLGRDAAAIHDFWAVLFKDYNLERYTRLRPLRGAFPREVELGRQRRSRRLSPSPMAPAPHRPQGKRKAPEEWDGGRAVQPSPRHTTSPGPHNPAGPLAKARTLKKPESTDAPHTPRAGALQAVATSVQRAVAVAGSEVPVTRGAVEGILIKHMLEPGSSKMGSKAGDEPYALAACEEPGARSRSRSLKPPTRPKASQSLPRGKGIIPAWQHGHGLGVPPVPGCPSSFPPTPLLSHRQSGEPQPLPQSQLSAPTVPSQDPVPHQWVRRGPSGRPWHISLAWPRTGKPQSPGYNCPKPGNSCPERGWFEWCGVNDAGGEGDGVEQTMGSPASMSPATASIAACRRGGGSDPPPPAPPGQENEDECAACGDGGELICCDGCPRAFHLACLVPPLPRVPSGTWRCGSCVASMAEPGQLREVDAERLPKIPGEEACSTRQSGGDGSICGRCFTQIPASQHCPTPSGDSGVLLLCTSCTSSRDTDRLERTGATGDHSIRAAKVSTTRAWPRRSERGQAEEVSHGSEPVLSRDELDALLGEGTWDGILQWAFQSMSRPLADTHGLFN